MIGTARWFKRNLAAVLAAVALVAPLPAPGEDLDTLHEKLRDPGFERWREAEREIWQHWSRSGSPSADLLLERGREAMEAERPGVAVEHFSALIDHAPNFAEGYHARATAFYSLQMFGPALADLERALALNPRHFGALMGLATMFEAMGAPEEALSAYRAVRAIHPHRPDLKDAIERLERRLGDEAI